MLVKIGVSFNVREARELVAELDVIARGEIDGNLNDYPMMSTLRKRLVSPLTPDKIPAMVENVQAP